VWTRGPSPSSCSASGGDGDLPVPLRLLVTTVPHHMLVTSCPKSWSVSATPSQAARQSRGRGLRDRDRSLRAERAGRRARGLLPSQQNPVPQCGITAREWRRRASPRVEIPSESYRKTQTNLRLSMDLRRPQHRTGPGTDPRPDPNPETTQPARLEAPPCWHQLRPATRTATASWPCLRALDGGYHGGTLIVAEELRGRLRLGHWRLIPDVTARRHGIGPDHPDAVALRGGRWVVVTCGPWASRLPDWPPG
jgi:hypothetical protein